MKLDWDKESGTWNIWDVDSDVLICRVQTVRLKVPSELIVTHGGRHGYLVTAGKLAVDDNIATITKG
jgi:hypothetical protein